MILQNNLHFCSPYWALCIKNLLENPMIFIKAWFAVLFRETKLILGQPCLLMFWAELKRALSRERTPFLNQLCVHLSAIFQRSQASAHQHKKVQLTLRKVCRQKSIWNWIGDKSERWLCLDKDQVVNPGIFLIVLSYFMMAINFVV